VKNRQFVLTLSLFIFISIFILSCKKINEATELGGGLIPAVDNVTTFDTTLSVETYNEIYTVLNDSTSSSLANEHFLGEITNNPVTGDPIFGKSEASIFVELKPAVYPFKFARKDSLFIDSVVLVLGYKETYGDSTDDFNVNVYEIESSKNFSSDSFYMVRERPFTGQGLLLGSRNNIIPNTLDDSVTLFREKASNQLRIPLNNSFGTRILDYDTSVYKTDSTFRTKFRGFEITASGGNSLLGFQLTDTNTKLAIYYHFKTAGQPDTGVSYFRATSLSASANHIKRDYTGSQFFAYLNNGSIPDDLVFLQNTPGSFATIKIPGLAGLNNRIVHRAEFIVEQVFHPSDEKFTPPDLLYLDAYDSLKSKFRTIPFDLSFDANSGQLNYQAFGMVGKKTIDGSGNPIQIWTFNLSRYIQHVVNDTKPSYNLRLHSPYLTHNLYSSSINDTELFIPINPTFAKGRVRVGGGSNSTQKMRLRIIYSKI
jgi:uncharacterized protein DUF4270